MGGKGIFEEMQEGSPEEGEYEGGFEMLESGARYWCWSDWRQPALGAHHEWVGPNGCKADPSASSTTKEVQEVVEVND